MRPNWTTERVYHCMAAMYVHTVTVIVSSYLRIGSCHRHVFEKEKKEEEQKKEIFCMHVCMYVCNSVHLTLSSPCSATARNILSQPSPAELNPDRRYKVVGKRSFFCKHKTKEVIGAQFKLC